MTVTLFWHSANEEEIFIAFSWAILICSHHNFQCDSCTGTEQQVLPVSSWGQKGLELRQQGTAGLSLA